MNADRSESSRVSNPCRAAAIAPRATGPISTSSPANATRRKASSVKSRRRLRTTVIRAPADGRPARGAGWPVRGAGWPVRCPSGLGSVPQEELALRGRVDPRDVLLRGAEVVVEVREDDRRLVEQKVLDLAGDALLGGRDHRGDVLLRQLVVGGVLEVRGVPGALPGLGID